jgi:hypothetical protein
MNLAHDHDRVIAKRLQQISVGEKKRREAAGLPDTSQHGDGEMFRNVFYTGKGAAIFSGRSAPVGGHKSGGVGGGEKEKKGKGEKEGRGSGTARMAIKGFGWGQQLPQDGLLELDFMWGARPKRETQAASEEEVLTIQRRIKSVVTYSLLPLSLFLSLSLSMSLSLFV